MCQIQDTTATRKVFALNKKIRAIAGGTSASKTISILIWCIDYAQSMRDSLVSIVSESFPHLRIGAIRDFKAIMKDRGYWKDSRWNETNHYYTFESGTIVEFFSSDTDKAHGPRRDILFLNEAQNLPFEEADQLIVRTKRIVLMDWNPSTEFWFYTDMLGKRDDIDFITLTYKDNEALDPEMVKEIESRKHRLGWWRVYGLGQLGEVEGKIYRDWNFIDNIPHEARLERIALDFGYTNDPTAIVAIYYYNGGYIIDEIAFQKGLSNKQIADIISNIEEKVVVVADSAEPKSIDEIGSYGISIIPAPKGADSVRNGIQTVQSQRISVTKRSVNVIKEYRSYLWEVDREGNKLNKPEHAWSHSMDAIRYGLSSLVEFLPNNLRREQEQRFVTTHARQGMNSTK